MAKSKDLLAMYKDCVRLAKESVKDLLSKKNGKVLVLNENDALDVLVVQKWSGEISEHRCKIIKLIGDTVYLKFTDETETSEEYVVGRDWLYILDTIEDYE